MEVYEFWGGGEIEKGLGLHFSGKESTIVPRP